MVADRNEVLNESHETIYGYPVKDLILFACACREQHITKEELRSFVGNALAGFSFGYKDIRNAFTSSMCEIFEENNEMASQSQTEQQMKKNFAKGWIFCLDEIRRNRMKTEIYKFDCCKAKVE